VNTVLQACFFALAEVLPPDEAVSRIKDAIQKSYGGKGADIVRRNHEAVDRALAHLQEVSVPGAVTSRFDVLPVVPDSAPTFVREVTAKMMLGLGGLGPRDLHPVRPVPLLLSPRGDPGPDVPLR
jgi:pyruvate-ferredoxin/flavodoxin oxidoreductase